MKTIPTSNMDFFKDNGVPEPSRYNSNVYDLNKNSGNINFFL